MKISIITPVLNEKKFIRETVESVISQKGGFELEYIIQDGGSTDGTLEILNSYADSDSRIILNSKPDKNAQEAINRGLNLATGDVLCWLGADDVYENNCLEVVAQTFKSHPKTQWIYGRCCIIDENGNKIRKLITWYKNVLGFFYSKNILFCENFINQPSTFFRKSFWEKASFLNTRFTAAWDYELWLTFASKYPAKPVHSYLAKFRRHSSSISENHFVRQFNEEVEIVKNYGNFLHVLIHRLVSLKIIAIYKILS